MVDFKSLGLGSYKQVREIVATPSGNIEIYEPNADMISKIIDTQRELGIGMDSDTITFGGKEVLCNLFPILTNIDFSESTDEDIDKVLENPSIHLLTAQQFVAQIVTEINKLYAQRLKTEFVNTDNLMAQLELMNSLPAIMVEKAKQEGKAQELAEKVEQVEEELEKAVEKEAEKEEKAEDSK